MDVTKFGDIPDGGGHRFVGRPQGKSNRAATARRTDETAATAIGVLEHAVAWFADRDVTIERVISDKRADGWAYARNYRSDTDRRQALPA